MLASFTISPVGDGESLSRPVADIVRLIDDSGLDYQLTAMATVIEGEPEHVFDLLQKCHAEMKKSHHRVTSHIMIDDRGDDMGRLVAKVDKVERLLAQSNPEPTVRS